MHKNCHFTPNQSFMVHHSWRFFSHFRCFCRKTHLVVFCFNVSVIFNVSVRTFLCVLCESNSVWDKVNKGLVELKEGPVCFQWPQAAGSVADGSFQLSLRRCFMSVKEVDSDSRFQNWDWDPSLGCTDQILRWSN